MKSLWDLECLTKEEFVAVTLGYGKNPILRINGTVPFCKTTENLARKIMLKLYISLGSIFNFPPVTKLCLCSG